MTLTLEWPQITFLAMVAVSWTGFLYGIIRALVLARISDLEVRVGESHTQTTLVQAELARFQAELPLLYERREDAVRSNTVINAKLDRLYELMAGRI